MAKPQKKIISIDMDAAKARLADAGEAVLAKVAEQAQSAGSLAKEQAGKSGRLLADKLCDAGIGLTNIQKRWLDKAKQKIKSS